MYFLNSFDKSFTSRLTASGNILGIRARSSNSNRGLKYDPLTVETPTVAVALLTSKNAGPVSVNTPTVEDDLRVPRGNFTISWMIFWKQT